MSNTTTSGIWPVQPTLPPNDLNAQTRSPDWDKFLQLFAIFVALPGTFIALYQLVLCIRSRMTGFTIEAATAVTDDTDIELGRGSQHTSRSADQSGNSLTGTLDMTVHSRSSTLAPGVEDIAMIQPENSIDH